MKDYAQRLLHWQPLHGRRDLPWQQGCEPYPVWVSEIMLQQTRVQTVLQYYPRFMHRFASLDALAQAPSEAVLACWSGLGYYARARNLHRAAQIILDEHGGQFPQTQAAINALPGIGRSTAAAIGAFCFGQRNAILDGNVRRILCRLHAIEGYPGEKSVADQLWQLAEAHLPVNPDAAAMRTYTQAQMDLGAMICTRTRPQCQRCPLHDPCLARQRNLTARLPTARPRKTLPLRHMDVLALTHRRAIAFEPRPPHGIWGGLFALPTPQRLHAIAPNLPGQPCLQLAHVFTHFRLDIKVFHIACANAEAPPTLPAGVRWIEFDSLDDCPLPSPMRRIADTLAKQNPPPQAC